MVPFQSLSPRPKDKHNGSLHTRAFPGHAWHALRTLNKGNERELAGEAWPRETEGTIESFVSLCSHTQRSPFYRRWLQREEMFPAMRHSVKLINKKTPNVSSAPKIATAKCVHWSSVREDINYISPASEFQSLPLSLFLSVCLILSLILRPVWCMKSFVCLSPHYHVVWITIITAGQHQNLPVDRIV